MKKEFTFLTLISCILIYSQNTYKEIKPDKLNSEKSKIGQNFIETFLDKCEKKDYLEFKNFTLSNNHKNFMNDNLEEICVSNAKTFGKINIKNLNSAYKNNSSLFGGNELYIFNSNTEKIKDIKYISVWISKNNIIDGMVITSEKPFNRYEIVKK